MKSRSMDMCSGPLLGKMIRYTIPIIFTGVLQLLFNAADMVVVGQFCGRSSLAAVGATGSLISLFVNLFTGLSTGAGVTTAQMIGRKHDFDVHKTVHTAIPLALISGVILTMLGLFGAEPMLHLMGTPESILPLSALYLRVYFAGITASLVYNYSAAILRAAGDTRGPMIYLSIAGVLNVLLNILFVTVIEMDVAGVSAATSLSNTVAAVLALRALRKRTDACRLEWKKMKIYKAMLLRILRFGIPAGVQGVIFSASNVLIQSSINSFGEAAVAGGSAASSIEGFVYTAQNAFYQTTMNFVGQNLGAGNFDRIRKIRRIALLCVTVTGLILGSIVYLFSQPLLSLYINGSAEAIALGQIRILYICVPYFLCGCMEVMSGTLRGLGASISSMMISLIGVVGFRITWIFSVFNRIEAFHTLEGLYISYPIAWVATTVTAYIWSNILLRRMQNTCTQKTDTEK